MAADLDVIILKALAKEPSRRYRSAEQLGDDLRRWLRGDPVRAQPDTLGYRAGKFVRRHRTLVGLAAVAFVSLVGGIAATAWQARVAGRERDVAEAALRRS
jgi:serine/threonine-protein kinase